MISIANITYHLGGRTLYNAASLHIKPKQKIGLVGMNGTGKTTLLRMIDGEITPDDGEISYSKEVTIGYLNQDLLSFNSERSILSVSMEAFVEANQVQVKIDEILKKLETEYTDKLLDQLGKLQEKFEALEGYTLQSKAEELLEGIGFTSADLSKPLKDFSGGWRMRVMLAKLLLQKPSLLLLDEPTNHLDLPSIQWVETYLRTYDGAVLLVSHDQEFVNRACNVIVEVSGQKLNSYSGNYDFYVAEKALRNEIQQNSFINQQQKIKQTEQFINRFRAKSSKARQVQSKVKSLEKIDRVEEVVDESRAVNFQFNFNKPSGKNVLFMQDMNKSYGALEIFRNTDAQVNRGDKIALVGANGKGKSTLLRILMNEESFEGKCQLGHNVISSFYAQHQLESLGLEHEIIEELKLHGSDKTDTELRSVLGCFLFTDDDVFKKVKVLSGGEKSRVALAKTLISEANFLILDEPTNHLDIQSVNILVQALQQYAGTFIIVSHNRHFISQTANKVWYIEDLELKEYPGTYDEFEIWYANRQSKPTPVAKAPEKQKEKKKQKPRSNAEMQAKKKLQNKVAKLESEIADTEIAIKALEAEMGTSFDDNEKLVELNADYQGKKDLLAKKNDEWLLLAEELDSLE